MHTNLAAAKFSTELAFDEDLGRLCLALFRGPAHVLAEKLPFEEMLTLARQAWTHLAAGVLPTAVTYAWDTDAQRRASDIAERLTPEDVLAPARVSWRREWDSN